MTSSVQSTVQVFYSIAGQTGYRFSEQNSLRFPVKKGKNDIYISLDYPKPGKHLRLDPITGLGEILIKTVEVRKVKKATRTVRKGAA